MPRVDFVSEKLSVDIAVIGAGFGGSLAALLLHRIGFRVVLLERGSHPRFALGESSTPTADLVLRDLARQYDLPFLGTISRYGEWQQAFPDVVRGPKRGFSYFYHRPEEEFVSYADHRNELYVAASQDEVHADTHWLRSDVDTLFVRQVESAGIPYFDHTQVTIQSDKPSWQLTGLREGASSITIAAEFLIDATGKAAFLPQTLGLTPIGDRMRTHSQAIFAHMEGVTPWETLLNQQHGSLDDYPFPCDAAALHHLLQDAWMWQLRFDNGVTSVGIASSIPPHGNKRTSSAQQQWETTLQRYPSLAQQFATARVVAPGNEVCQTSRLQRQWSRFCGDNWALLPHTAGFVDPLYSSGIAQTVCGVERLCSLLERSWQREDMPARLQQYSQAMEAELDLLDELISGSYAAMSRFDLFVPYSMLYFAAATNYETERLATGFQPNQAMLCAADPAFRTMVSKVHQQLIQALQTPPDGQRYGRFFQVVAEAIAPFNIAGLCDTTVNNLYRYTAVDKS